MSDFKKYLNVYQFETTLPGTGELIQFKPITTGQIKKLLVYEGSENLNIIENILPREETKYLEIEAKLKQQIKDAKAEFESYKTQSKELARCVRENSQDVKIKAGDVYRIAHNGFFIYLTVNHGRAIPIKVEEIDSEDLQKWDNGVNQEKSQSFFNQNKEDLKEAK